MDESLLHEIWQQQAFLPQNLRSVCGKPIIIWEKGQWNRTDGPDFVSATIQVGHIKLQGNVEIHIRASDWNKHNHHLNPEYNSVILHVVWHADVNIKTQQGTEVYTLELQTRLNTELISMVQQKIEFLCLPYVKTMNIWRNQIEQAHKQRLAKKIENTLITHHSALKNDWWLTSIWCILSSYLGSHNSNHALSMVMQFNKKVILTCTHTDQLIAYMLGTAGFLNSSKAVLIALTNNTQLPNFDGLPQLEIAYKTLKFKYQLPENLPIPWDFKEVRPASFPQIRIAQFAHWLFHYRNTMDEITNSALNPILFQKIPNPEQTTLNIPPVGKTKAQSIAINAISLLKLCKYHPSITAYQRLKKELSNLPTEDHRIIRKFRPPFPSCTTALESQQFLSQYQEFCSKRKCLHCQIGQELLCRTST